MLVSDFVRNEFDRLAILLAMLLLRHNAAIRAPGTGFRRSYGSLRHNAAIRVQGTERRDRKTAIVCTVGPASWHKEGIRELLLRGMNVLRLNFSHGTHEDKARVIGDLRSVLTEFRAAMGGSGDIDFDDGSREDVCAIAADTKGPEIRTGRFRAGLVEEISSRSSSSSSSGGGGGISAVPIARGDQVVLSCDPDDRDECTASRVFCDYATLAAEVSPGQRIFVDDGLLALEVVDTTTTTTGGGGGGGGQVKCVALNSGLLGEQKGVNIPFPFKSNLPSVTEQDERDLAFAAAQGVDYIFASFIRSARDVEAVRYALGSSSSGNSTGGGVRVISKIENQEGVENFDEILAASDGVMVARGDLGIEIPPEQVFLAQKMMIARCNVVGKPVICATQMLESMVHNPRPTRAECSDVANAVLDGADAVMLSGETAKGAFPFESVDMMSQICREAEVGVDYPSLFRDLRRATADRKMKQQEELQQAGGGGGGAAGNTSNSTTGTMFGPRLEALATSCVVAAEELDAAAIIVLTKSGDTAQAVAKYRPACPILAIVASEATANRLILSRGVIPLLVTGRHLEDSGEALQFAVDALRDMGIYDGDGSGGGGGGGGGGTGQKIVAITGSGGGWCTDAVRQMVFL